MKTGEKVRRDKKWSRLWYLPLSMFWVLSFLFDGGEMTVLRAQIEAGALSLSDSDLGLGQWVCCGDGLLAVLSLLEFFFFWKLGLGRPWGHLREGCLLLLAGLCCAAGLRILPWEYEPLYWSAVRAAAAAVLLGAAAHQIWKYVRLKCAQSKYPEK